MTSQPKAIHILPNISRSKGKSINMRNIFAEKSYTKCGGETVARPLSK